MKRKSNILLSVSFVMSIASCGTNPSSDQMGDSESSFSSIAESASSEMNSSNEESSSLESNSSSEESSSIESTSQEESTNPSQSESSFPDESSSSEKQDVVVNENFVFPSISVGSPTVKNMTELKEYTPTTFSSSSYTKTVTELYDGVDLYKCDYTLDNVTNGKVTAYCVEVDLSKANIVAGCTDNDLTKSSTKSVPTSQADAWEKDHPNQKAIAVTNADYFGSTCVNAFVKDGKIVKDSHNQTPDDLPVSSPMLFGVSSAGARIGAMTTTNNQKTDYTSKLSYFPAMSLYQENGEIINTLDTGKLNSGNRTTAYSICKKAGKYSFAKGFVYKVKFIQQDQCSDDEIRGCLIEKYTLTEVEQYEITSADEQNGIGYFAVGSKLETEYEVNSYLNYYQYITSPNGGIWNYYDTILGCRHSLVENGAVAPTVGKETSNGAQSRVPRTAVGIKPDGKVVIVSIEDLHYGKLASVCTGVNLTQLADFMRYYGCYDAANFDGGGSSQLSTKTVSENAWNVITRSSDTGSSLPTSTRKVMNTIIVTTK